MHDPRLTFGVMARAAVPGRCKTRLARSIGDEAAARLYSAMLEDRMASLRAVGDARLVVVAAPEDDGVRVLGAVAPPGWEILPQRGDGLGERLAAAFVDLLPGGGRVCLVDSDSPTVSLAACASDIRAADEDVVLGPCDDGGYYLIGLRALHPELFQEIPWSTEAVLEATRARARDAGLALRELSLGWDVDDAGGLARLRRELSGAASRAPRTAEVLAALPEAP